MPLGPNWREKWCFWVGERSRGDEQGRASNSPARCGDVILLSSAVHCTLILPKGGPKNEREENGPAAPSLLLGFEDKSYFKTKFTKEPESLSHREAQQGKDMFVVHQFPGLQFLIYPCFMCSSTGFIKVIIKKEHDEGSLHSPWRPYTIAIQCPQGSLWFWSLSTLWPNITDIYICTYTIHMAGEYSMFLFAWMQKLLTRE